MTKGNPTFMKIEASGFVCELVCGLVPRKVLEAFQAHILKRRNLDALPPWILRKVPGYVPPELVNQAWYGKDGALREAMMRGGLSANSYLEIDDICHLTGLGSGKEGVGIFDARVSFQDQTLLEILPCRPLTPVEYPILELQQLGQRRLSPPPLVLEGEDRVAVSAGWWAKGTMLFQGPCGERPFEAQELELLVTDLTGLGFGEEHFVTGFSWRGSELHKAVARLGPKEYFPVCWFHPIKGRWCDMYVPWET